MEDRIYDRRFYGSMINFGPVVCVESISHWRVSLSEFYGFGPNISLAYN